MRGAGCVALLREGGEKPNRHPRMRGPVDGPGSRKDARKMHREEGEKQEGEKQESGLAAALFEKMNWLELPLVVGLDSRV